MTTIGPTEHTDLVRRARALHRRTLAAARRAAAARGIRDRALDARTRARTDARTPLPPRTPPPVRVVRPTAFRDDPATQMMRAVAYTAAAAVAAQAAREWAEQAVAEERDLAHAHAERADAHAESWQERLTELGVTTQMLDQGADHGAAILDDEGSGVEVDAIAEGTFDAVAAHPGPEPTVAELLDRASGNDTAVPAGPIAEPPHGVHGLDHTAELGRDTTSEAQL